MGSVGDRRLAGFCWGENVFGFCQSMLIGFCLGGFSYIRDGTLVVISLGGNTGLVPRRGHWLESIG